MFAIVYLLATFIADLFKSRRPLEVENLFLRHQLNIILRRPPQRLRPQLRPLLYTYTFSRAKIVISVVLDSSCTGCEPAPDHKPGPPGNAVPMMSGSAARAFSRVATPIRTTAVRGTHVARKVEVRNPTRKSVPESGHRLRSLAWKPPRH